MVMIAMYWLLILFMQVVIEAPFTQLVDEAFAWRFQPTVLVKRLKAADIAIDHVLVQRRHSRAHVLSVRCNKCL